MKPGVSPESRVIIFIALCLFGTFFAGVFGWVWNIIKIWQADALTGMVLARMLGAVMIPVGAVIGYF